MDVERSLRELLAFVRVRPRRLSLATPGVRATAPMLRGVWGAALRRLDEGAYEQVFTGRRSRTGLPGYIVRPASPDPADAPAVDWILFGEASDRDGSLLQAWREAAARGLGPERRPFAIRAIREYAPDGGLRADGDSTEGWLLEDASWPLPQAAPCRLAFDAPVRILRQGRLIAAPTIADLAVAALRRVRPLLRAAERSTLDTLRPLVLEVARDLPASPWRGQRLDLQRWSGRQKRELEVRGVAGSIDLPDGPGRLQPLFAAGRWLHLGKATTVGLGRLEVAALGSPRLRL